VCTIQSATPDVKCEPGVRVVDEEIKNQSKRKKNQKRRDDRRAKKRKQKEM
jgi:hypothetical protein